jgi:hypothetical protein
MKTAVRRAPARLSDIGSMVGSNTPMPRRFRFVALLALLVASVAGLAACGGDDGGSQDANSLLKATFGPDQNVKSGNLTVALGLDLKGLQNIQGPINLKLNGPFQTVGKGKLPQLDLSLTLSGSGANFAAGAVTDGEKGWLKLQGTTYAVDDATFAKFKNGYEDSAAKSKSDSGAPSFKSLGIDPLRWLTHPEVAGTEEVGGAETEHITAGVDVAKFLDDVSALLGKAGQLGQATAGVPSSLTEQQRKDIEASVKDATLDVWTGKDDKALRRVKLTIGVEVPEAVRSRAGGLSTGTVNFDLTIADLNEPQTIEAPKNARPLSELTRLIAGGATGATSSQTQTQPSGSGTASSKYLDCISKAGSDVAEIQKCATLVGQ